MVHSVARTDDSVARTDDIVRCVVGSGPAVRVRSGPLLVGGSGQNAVVPTYLALLRGINVGGHSKVAMADLRALMVRLGHTDVATYIQSGNAVFTSGVSDSTALAAALERAIADTLDVRPKVVVISCAQLAQVIADNPYPEETNPRCLHAVFGVGEIGLDGVAALAAAEGRARAKGSRDEAQVVGRTLFLRTPDGLGRSELSAQLSRAAAARTGYSVGTARNWATVCKLLELCGG